MVNTYLLLAFFAFWAIFFLYVWTFSRRQARLQKELEELKNKKEVKRLESEARNQKSRV